MAADNLSPARLRELLAYDQDTGEFSWRVNRGGGARAGDAAGHLSSSGYVVIKFGFTAKKAHRLAWLYQYGVWPNGELDHIDGNKKNNRVENLEYVTRQENVRHAFELGLRGKLSMQAANDIRADYASGATQASLAKRYGVSKPTISNVVHNKTWRAA